MFRNYLISAIRNIRNSRLYSVINITGLAVGMTVCLLLMSHVRYERSYDRFHSKADRIYRLRYERTDQDGTTVRFASCCPPAGLAVREKLPEAEKVARFFQYRASVQVGNNAFYEERMFFAESELFAIFDVPFIAGGGMDLREPNRAYISASTAKKFFGDANPVGRTFGVDKKADYKVAGVFADMPQNSHVKFDILLSYVNIYDLYGRDVEESWGDSGWFTYILFAPGTDAAEAGRRLSQAIEPPINERWKPYGLTMQLVLQRLTDIHLTSHYMQEFEPNGDADVVGYLAIIAALVIVIAWVNYVNLSTARALTRAKEVGLRKTLGATRFELCVQFFTETIVINLFAVALAVIALLFPYYEVFTGTPSDPDLWTRAWFWQAVGVMFVAGVILSGAYPVAVLSSFAPVDVLRGKLGGTPGRFNFRKFLVVFQIAIALVLMSVTVTVTRQITYLKSKDTGFSMENKLVVRAPRVRTAGFAGTVETMRTELLRTTDITGFCVVTEVPGRQLLWDAGDIHRVGDDQNARNYQIVGADYDFAQVFGLTFTAGRNFSKKFGTDTAAILLNETAVKWMGFPSADSAVGARVSYWDQVYTVIGVVKDYHQQSPKQDYEPTLFRLMPFGRGVRGMFVIAAAPGALPSVLPQVAEMYRQRFPGNPFEHFVLDEYYERQYASDRQFGIVFGGFSFLALFVTSLGTLGLTLFMIDQRRKELGIRKVLGAHPAGLVLLMTKELFLLMGIAFVAAVPAAWWGIRLWLASYPERIGITPDLFLLPLLIAAVVMGAAIGVSVYRAASADPVQNLRYE